MTADQWKVEGRVDWKKYFFSQNIKGASVNTKKRTMYQNQQFFSIRDKVLVLKSWSFRPVDLKGESFKIINYE